MSHFCLGPRSNNNATTNPKMEKSLLPPCHRARSQPATHPKKSLLRMWRTSNFNHTNPREHVGRGASTRNLGTCMPSPLSTALRSPPLYFSRLFHVRCPCFQATMTISATHHHRQHVGGLDGDGVHQPGHDDYSSCSLSAEPGSSFCWDPVLQGSTSPASSRSSTLGQARRDRRWVRRSRAPPPVRASHPPLPPHAPIPYPFAAFHRPRAAIHASVALSPFAFVRAGAL